MTQTLRFNALRAALMAGLALSLAGCGVNSVLPPNGTDSIAAAVTGTIHGGPNPVVGAEVILYATTSSGYGMGTQLQEATQVGASAHQDTDSRGFFSFAGGYTCPAGQYAYVVAYGGNSGSGVNPNAVLMTALGPCNTISSSTNIWIDELTTVAAGYALSNFINVTGNAVNGYTVGIGSTATNNSSTGQGCVANAYYGSSCTTTAAAGLGHAFTTAANLVNTSTGQVNATTTNGAIIPAQLINTLGNVLQACVNSTGGGTSTTTGLPTTTTTSAGASHDGTACGRLSAYTSYTSNGTTGGTLNAAGNTLGFIQNLAKRPGGTVATFDTACDSASAASGTTPAATCIFNLAPTQSFYSLSMTAPPPDWMLAIFYPKSSLSATTTATTACSSANTPTTLGVLYPYMLATDINDNIDILNGDGSTNVCYNLISIGFDGTPIAATAFDSSGYQLNWIANDSFGHSIVPLRTTGTTGGVVRVYSTGADSAIARVAAETSTAALVAGDPWWVAVDGNDNIYVDGQAGVANGDFGYLQLSGANSHSSPTYTGGAISGYSGTSKGLQISIDINNNIFWETSSSSGSTRPYFTNAGGTATFTQAPSSDEGGGSTSNGAVQFPDTSGNQWTVYTIQATSAQGSPINDIAFATPYSVAAGAITYGTTPSTYTPTTAIPATDYKLQPGAIDGNNVIWWPDLQGSITCNGGTCSAPDATPIVINTSYLHGFDTVNRDYLPTYYGCEFNTPTSTACGTQPTDTNYPNSYAYALYGVRGLAVDSAGDIWTANGVQGHITEIIGMAAPTWPMFIHNGSSNKP